MHSSRSLRRPSLFALSLSITLSFSPSISSLSFSLLPTFLVSSSSCISLPLSPSFFLFQLVPASVPLLLPLALSIAIPLPSSVESTLFVEPTMRSASRYVHPPRSFSLLFILLSLSLSLYFIPFRLSFPGLVHALFSSLCARLAQVVPSLSLSFSLPPRGFSFADVYISRQVGMQGRTSYAATCECVRARVGTH